MEAPIEIRYAGVVVGRAQELTATEGDADAFFIPVRDPMPVGTLVRLRSRDQETPARVVRAVEGADPASSGMHVRVVGEAVEVPPELIPPPPVVVEKPAVAPVVVAPVPHNVVPVVEMRPDHTPVVAIETGQTEEMPAVEAPSPGEPAEAAASEAAPVAATTEPVPAEPAPAEAPAPEAVAEPAPVAAPDEAVPTEMPRQRSARVFAAVAEPASGAVPEAIPVAIGSSMTGALENAAESIPVAVPVDSSVAPSSESGSAGVKVEQADSGSAAAATPTEDLPPARPIAGPSTRRKTKRRK